MTAESLARATALLNAMGILEAARLLGSPVDFALFISENKLDLDEFEIRELRSNFRA